MCLSQLAVVLLYSVGNMELPLFDGSLRETLDLLGVDNLLSVLTSLLLEHQILLYSEGKAYSKGQRRHIQEPCSVYVQLFTVRMFYL